MCLAVPGRVQTVYERDGIVMGKVDFGGVIKEVCFAYLPETVVDDFVIVHVGFALSKVDEASARRTLDLIGELSEPIVGGGNDDPNPR